MIRKSRRYEYDAFGTPYQGDFSSGMNLGYTGKPYDPATGLYNYGYRDYQPVAARFTTVDPIRDGNNWFAYVNNDPVNYVDPWGLKGRITNNTDKTILVKPEYPLDTDNAFEPVAPDGIYNGDIDGVLTPDGKTYKGYPGSQAKVTEKNGTYSFETTKGTDLMNDLYNGIKDLTHDSRERYGVYSDFGAGYPGLEDWWKNALQEEGKPSEWGKGKQSTGCGN
jgi:RHS repeat-associated protein